MVLILVLLALVTECYSTTNAMLYVWINSKIVSIVISTLVDVSSAKMIFSWKATPATK